MDRKMLRNVEIRGVHAAGNGPSSDRKCWQRLELGIHGLNRWTVKCLENAEFKQTKRPERGQMCWQCLERNRSPLPTPAGGPVAKPEIITLAPKKLIRTRRASEGSASEPSLARRVSMC